MKISPSAAWSAMILIAKYYTQPVGSLPAASACLPAAMVIKHVLLLQHADGNEPTAISQFFIGVIRRLFWRLASERHISSIVPESYVGIQISTPQPRPFFSCLLLVGSCQGESLRGCKLVLTKIHHSPLFYSSA